MSRRDVFVSYSHADREAAMELVSCVEAHGIECWVAPRDVAPAADWAEEIVDAIAQARVMVLVFSGSANESPQVRREVERAVHKGTAILPVRIESVLPTKSLEYFLSSQHWLDAFPAPRQPHYSRLCASLRAILAGTSASRIGDTTSRAGSTMSPVHFDELTLRVLENELAHRVGPIAKHLVKRAAQHAKTREDLVGRLAVEIDSEEEREAFLKAAQ